MAKVKPLKDLPLEIMPFITLLFTTPVRAPFFLEEKLVGVIYFKIWLSTWMIPTFGSYLMSFKSEKYVALPRLTKTSASKY